MIALLVARGADVHQRLRCGGACLHEAVKRGSLAATRALTARGADPNTADGEGLTAIQLAEQLALPQVLAALISAAVTASVDLSLRAATQREQVLTTLLSLFVCMLVADDPSQHSTTTPMLVH